MSSASIEIYTTGYCGYCRRAKSLLEDKGVTYEEIRVDFDPARRAEMTERASGRRTVPQIFVDGRGIGGCDELFELDRKGQLDQLLSEKRDSND
ncbi:MAG: glutaredoxin 3 [Proteobacteria bacterium]|nr:glutaredoxin 3 [Pseudomonadota bacterium]